MIGACVVLGVLLGGFGTVLGVSLGALLSLGLPQAYQWLAGTLEMDLMSQYFVRYLPVEVQLADLVGIAATAFVLCLLSTVYPARRALRLKPAEVLAHE